MWCLNCVYTYIYIYYLCLEIEINQQPNSVNEEEADLNEILQPSKKNNLENIEQPSAKVRRVVRLNGTGKKRRISKAHKIASRKVKKQNENSETIENASTDTPHVVDDTEDVDVVAEATETTPPANAIEKATTPSSSVDDTDSTKPAADITKEVKKTQIDVHPVNIISSFDIINNPNFAINHSVDMVDESLTSVKNYKNDDITTHDDIMVNEVLENTPTVVGSELGLPYTAEATPDKSPTQIDENSELVCEPSTDDVEMTPKSVESAVLLDMDTHKNVPTKQLKTVMDHVVSQQIPANFEMQSVSQLFASFLKSPMPSSVLSQGHTMDSLIQPPGSVTAGDEAYLGFTQTCSSSVVSTPKNTLPSTPATATVTTGAKTIVAMGADMSSRTPTDTVYSVVDQMLQQKNFTNTTNDFEKMNNFLQNKFATQFNVQHPSVRPSLYPIVQYNIQPEGYQNVQLKDPTKMIPDDSATELNIVINFGPNSKAKFSKIDGDSKRMIVSIVNESNDSTNKDGVMAMANVHGSPSFINLASTDINYDRNVQVYNYQNDFSGYSQMRCCGVCQGKTVFINSLPGSCIPNILDMFMQVQYHLAPTIFHLPQAESSTDRFSQIAETCEFFSLFNTTTKEVLEGPQFVFDPHIGNQYFFGVYSQRVYPHLCMKQGQCLIRISELHQVFNGIKVMPYAKMPSRCSSETLRIIIFSFDNDVVFEFPKNEFWSKENVSMYLKKSDPTNFRYVFTTYETMKNVKVYGNCTVQIVYLNRSITERKNCVISRTIPLDAKMLHYNMDGQFNKKPSNQNSEMVNACVLNVYRKGKNKK